MKIMAVTKYVTYDGSMFDSEEDAQDYQTFENAVKSLEEFLDKNDIGCYSDNHEIAVTILNTYKLEKK